MLRVKASMLRESPIDMSVNICKIIHLLNYRRFFVNYAF